VIAAASITALLARAIVSLAIVLTIVAVAYVVARRRAGGVAPVTAGSSDRSRFGRRRTAPAPIEVVGRVGLTRGTAAVAIRFGDRVVLVAAPEQGPSNVISEMAAAEWDELRTVREPIVQAASRPAQPVPPTSVVGARPSFVEALRQATARHA
jgi:hypothetical protein